MSETKQDATAHEWAIPQDVVDRYVLRYPFLHTLGTQIPSQVAGRRAARSFAQACCRLSAPPTVTPREIWNLGAIAEGGTWPLPTEPS